MSVLWSGSSSVHMAGVAIGVGLRVLTLIVALPLAFCVVCKVLVHFAAAMANRQGV